MPSGPARSDASTRLYDYATVRLFAPAALALIVFFSHAWLAMLLDARGWFADYDFLFDADPNIRGETFAIAYPGGESIVDWLPHSVHPLLAYLIGMPIRIVSKLVGWVGLAPADDVGAFLALMVSPAAMAIKTFLLVPLLVGMGLSAGRALLMATLAAVSFGDVLFGSVPESFPITAALMILLLWLQRNGAPRLPQRARRPALIAVQVAAIGVTITNAAWVWAARVTSGSWREALMVSRWIRAGVWCLVAVIGIVAAGYVLPELHGYNDLLRERRAAEAAKGLDKGPMVQRFAKFDPQHIAAQTVEVPRTMLRSVYPPPAAAVMQKEDPSLVAPDVQRRFTMVGVNASAGEILVHAVLLALLVAGVRAGWAVPHIRPLLAFALVVLATNFAMFVVFGREPFLYAQHWLPALVLCIAPALVSRGRSGAIATAAVAALVVLTGIQSGTLVRWMLAQTL
jgi:hypothetical protein